MDYFINSLNDIIKQNNYETFKKCMNSRNMWIYLNFEYITYSEYADCDSDYEDEIYPHLNKPSDKLMEQMVNDDEIDDIIKFEFCLCVGSYDLVFKLLYRDKTDSDHFIRYMFTLYPQINLFLETNGDKFFAYINELSNDRYNYIIKKIIEIDHDSKFAKYIITEYGQLNYRCLSLDKIIEYICSSDCKFDEICKFLSFFIDGCLRFSNNEIISILELFERYLKTCEQFEKIKNINILTVVISHIDEHLHSKCYNKYHNRTVIDILISIINICNEKLIDTPNMPYNIIKIIKTLNYNDKIIEMFKNLELMNTH